MVYVESTFVYGACDEFARGTITTIGGKRYGGLHRFFDTRAAYHFGPLLRFGAVAIARRALLQL